MLLFLSLTGILLSVILLVFNAGRFKSSWFLGCFFFLVSLYAFTQYIIVDSRSVLLCTIFFVHPGFLFYLIGPALYFYVRSALTDQVRFRKSDLWHLLPSLIYLLSSLPYFVLPLHVKEANAIMLANDIANLKYIRASLLYDFVHPAVIFISRPLLVFGYAAWLTGIIYRWCKTRQNTLVLSRQHYMITWMVVLLAFIFILTISHLAAMMVAYLSNDLKVFFTLKLLQLFSGVGLTGLLISPLFFPSILYGLPRLPVNRPGISPSHPPRGDDQDSPGASLASLAGEAPKQGFEAEYMKLIGSKMEECMGHLQPYLQNECNLAYMSKLTGIPAHHLAYYFREEKMQPFNDYRNLWRVRHAQTLLREGKARELTLEAIGMLSGFSTRNTFYKAFKKVAGISPKAYAEGIQVQGN